MAKVFYTQSEKTDKKYPISQAITLAKQTIQEKTKYRQHKVPVKVSQQHNPNTLITMVELNQLVEKIVNDTMDDLVYF